MKRTSLILLLNFMLLLCFHGYQWSEEKEILKFKSGDTLEELRRKITHNNYNFEVSHNWVYDMSPEQKKAFFSRRPPRDKEGIPVNTDIGPLAEHLGKELPASFDWRNYQGHSYIGAIRDQGYCGSCYAFGACAAAEGTYNYAMGLYDGNRIDFSESFIIWCLGDLSAYYSHFYGCEGSDYDYYELQAGVDYGYIRESYFPYQENEPSSCTHMSDPRIAFAGWYRVPCGDIDAIKTAIMTYGVVDAAVDVKSGFEAYSSGVYQDSNTSCNSNPCYYTSTNHAVALVGWDNADGAFILRNSWGTYWGENGYMRIKYTSARVACEVCYMVYSAASNSITVTSPNGGESWAPGSSHNITWTSTGTVGNVKIEYTTNNGSTWSTVSSSTANDGSYTWTVPSVSSTQCKVKISEASDGSPSDTSNAVFTISSGGSGSATISLNRTKFYFASVIAGQQTGNQYLRISNSGSGTLSWSVSDTASWLSCSPASGTGSGIVTLTVNPSGLTAGNYTGTVTVSSTNAVNSPQAASVYLTVYGANQDQAPFGAFSTPVNGANVSSSFAVSGWVLDDVEVMSVKIYNGNSYIGDAILVEGARTDIENAYPTYPMNYKAGWGYMLLSYFLPNGGNGTYTLSAKATDKAGHTVSLGSSVIHCNNAASVKPFGAIDLPAQGGTASGGSYRNSGWVLTPMPNMIPTSGSTINVYVNGVYLGHPTYNVYRSDIASLFPGYANSYGAAAYYDFNTTAYTNGVYTIYWIATDNAGNADGIGSRYFTIQNSGTRNSGTGSSVPAGPGSWFPGSVHNYMQGPVGVLTGFDQNAKPTPLHPDENGIVTVNIRELNRVVIQLEPAAWTGYHISGDQLKPLPIGSTLDVENGVFYWQPGPGFLGTYQLVFIAEQENQVRRVDVTITPGH